MNDTQPEIIRGTLDMIILKTLALDRSHGYGVSVRIRQISGDVLQVEEGSLYPALYRLERRGLIKSEWGTSENNRKAKFYDLTPNGRRHLESEEANWTRMSDAISRILSLEAAPQISS